MKWSANQLNRCSDHFPPGAKRNHPPDGLFDFQNLEDLVLLLSQNLGVPVPEVYERLFRAALQSGWNVRCAAEAFGVTPHVYDKTMEAFYRETNAFAFDLAVVHQHPFCIEIDRRVVEAVEANAARADRIPSILLLGDGIGSDSLRFAVAGYGVTYFEFKGFSAAIAVARFQNQGMLEAIRILHALEEIPSNTFDFVICREVLEHVNDPPAVVGNIWRYLVLGGVAIITESFGRVEPSYPTHIAANLPYAGKTEHLFINAGFRCERSFPGRRPMVFRKTQMDDQSRFKTLPRVSRVKRIIRGLIRRLSPLVKN